MKTSELRGPGSSSRGPSSFLLLGLDQFDDPTMEQCGILIGYAKEDLMRICLVENRAENPREDYEIVEDGTSLDLLPGEYVAGFIHTHLEHHEATPSPKDFLGAVQSYYVNKGYIHIVYKPSTGEMFQYGPDWSERVT